MAIWLGQYPLCLGRSSCASCKRHAGSPCVDRYRTTRLRWPVDGQLECETVFPVPPIPPETPQFRETA